MLKDYCLNKFPYGRDQNSRQKTVSKKKTQDRKGNHMTARAYKMGFQTSE